MMQSNNLYFNFPNFCAFFLHFFGILTLFNTFADLNLLLTLQKQRYNAIFVPQTNKQ